MTTYSHNREINFQITSAENRSQAYKARVRDIISATDATTTGHNQQPGDSGYPEQSAVVAALLDRVNQVRQAQLATDARKWAEHEAKMGEIRDEPVSPREDIGYGRPV